MGLFVFNSGGNGRLMNSRGFVQITIAAAGAVAGIALGQVYLKQIWPAFSTEAYKSVLPPNALPLRFISNLIECLTMFSAGAICGITSSLTGGRRFRIPITVVGYIYAFLRLLPYGFLEGSPALFPIPLFGSGFGALGIWAGFWFTTAMAGISARLRTATG